MAEPHARNRRWHRSTIAAAGIILLWAVAMSPLLTWGLPTSEADDLLFGDESPWAPATYDVEADVERLATRAAGADTDLNPIESRERIVELTTDHAARAEILRRYRLFSRQPDEMIILRSLQRMRPRSLDLDPRLYQYGGAYIYAIGAIIGVGATTGIIELTTDAGYYLEHPEAFGRLYVAARLVSLVFGAFALLAVFKLGRRAGGVATGWIAMVLAAASPVFIVGVLEAKPHLPSACMALWATLSALDYRKTGRMGDALRMGWQAGLSFGLVLTGVVAALLWPVAWLAQPATRRQHAARQLLGAAGLAIAVHAVCNPYLYYNAVFDIDALTSNLGNSTAMYEGQAARIIDGLQRVGELLIAGGGLGLVVVGALATIAMLLRYRGATAIAAATGVGMLVVGVLTGAGKPAEFARFLVLPLLLLCVTAGWLIGSMRGQWRWLGAVGVVFVVAFMPTWAYIAAYWQDAAYTNESRHIMAEAIETELATDVSIAVIQEPAPYAVPPIDFAHRRVVLLPHHRPKSLLETELPPWLVLTADSKDTHRDAWWQEHYSLAATTVDSGSKERHGSVWSRLIHRRTPITWANKPVYLYRNRHDLQRTSSRPGLDQTGKLPARSSHINNRAATESAKSGIPPGQ